ncbi:hypothetical protein Q8A73_007440 [Channa argus]|nr:hypothetical protein Q8A73_007440 [Channa argus]
MAASRDHYCQGEIEEMTVVRNVEFSVQAVASLVFVTLNEFGVLWSEVLTILPDCHFSTLLVQLVRLSQSTAYYQFVMTPFPRLPSHPNRCFTTVINSSDTLDVSFERCCLEANASPAADLKLRTDTV